MKKTLSMNELNETTYKDLNIYLAFHVKNCIALVDCILIGHLYLNMEYTSFSKYVEMPYFFYGIVFLSSVLNKIIIFLAID